MQDESQDFIKRQQLRELAMLNSNFREESPGPSGSVSPFNSSGMKRPKTGRWERARIFAFLELFPTQLQKKYMAGNALAILVSSAQLQNE